MSQQEMMVSRVIPSTATFPGPATLRTVPLTVALILGLIAPRIVVANSCRTKEIPMELDEVIDDLFAVDGSDHPDGSTYRVSVADEEALLVVPTGEFQAVDALLNVTALQPGTTTITVIWIHEPSFTSGTCEIEVTVNPPEPEDASAANFRASGVTGDPVNTLTGELVLREPAELYLPGPMPLYFQRYYASKLRRAFVLSGLGDNWRHNYDWTIHTTGNVLVLVDGDGRVIRYIKPDTQTNVWEQKTRLDTPRPVIQETGGDENQFFFLDQETRYVYRFAVPEGDTGFRLVEISDGRGNALALHYFMGRLQEVVDGLGRRLGFVYGPLGVSFPFRKVDGVRGGAVIDGELQPGQRVLRLYYQEDNLTSVFDPKNDLIRYRYDTEHADPGLMTNRLLHDNGVPYVYTWDDRGRVATQTDSSQNTTTFTYSDTPREDGSVETSIETPRGAKITHAHDAEGRLTDVTNAKGEKRVLESDAVGHRERVTQPLGSSRSVSRDASTGQPEIVTNAEGEEATFDYEERVMPPGFTVKDLTAIHFPDGTSITFTYDAQGNQLTRTDRAGNTWTRTYNDRGQLLTQTNPLGGVYVYTYNDDATRASVTDPAGNTTRFEYDAWRVSRVIRPDGSTREFAYDKRNRLTAITDETGQTTTYEWNSNGELISITDPDGNVTTRAYDANGRLMALTDRTGASTEYTWDDLGLPTTARFENGDVYTWSWDDAEQLASLELPDGSAYGCSVDADGRRTGVTNPGGETDSVTLGPDDTIESASDADGGVTAFEYDVLGRVISRTDPGGRGEAYTFTPNDRLASIALEPSGLGMSFEYDALDRMTSLRDPSGNAWNWTHDNQGRLTSATDPLGNTSNFTYDVRSRISEVELPGAMGTETVEYDAFGQVTRRSWSDGGSAETTYDHLGRPASVDGVTLGYDAESRVVETNGLTLTRTAHRGAIETLTLAPDRTITYSYDPAGRVTRVEDWAGGFVTFDYDAAGQVAAVTRSNSTTTAMTYDGPGRVASIEHGTFGSITIERDGSGNPTSVERDLPLPELPLPPDATYTYDAAHRVEAFTYDAMGRCTADARRTYTWDLASNLQSYSEDGATVAFTYDGFGNVLTRTEGGETTSYVWNYALRLPSVSVLRVGDSDVRYFVHHPSGALLYSVSATDDVRWFYHFDERGNTVLLTDDAGGVAASYAYTPYGGVATSDPDVGNPFTFAGRFGVLQEGDGGLYLMRRRYYDSDSARFLSLEPVRPHLHPLTFNPYQYAAGNPMRYLDAAGYDPADVDAASQDSGALDVLGAAVNVIGALAGAAGFAGQELGDKADELAKLADKALGAAGLYAHYAFAYSQANKGDPRWAQGAAKWVDRFTDLDAKAEKLASASKTLKAIGQVGDGLTALSTVSELKKVVGRHNQTREAYQHLQEELVETYRTRSRDAWDLFERGKKTEAWLRSQLRLYKLEYDRDVLWSDYTHLVDVNINLWTGIGDLYGALVPGYSLLGTEAISDTAHQHFWRPDANP